MDNQDIIHLIEVMEDSITLEEETDKLVVFFALKNYLTYLTNNGGKLSRVLNVTKLLERMFPEIREYALSKLKEETTEVVSKTNEKLNKLWMETQ